MAYFDNQVGLQTHNPMTGDIGFDPASYGLTQQDIKDSASPELKTTFTGGNIAITSEVIQEMRNLSLRKYSTITMAENMSDKNTGLYLNNERMGYWDKAANDWIAYIDNIGNFRLSHPTLNDNSIEWNSTLGKLTIKGDIEGSTITGSTFKTDSGLSRIEISSAEIRGYADNGLGSSRHFATIMPSTFVGGLKGVAINAGLDGGGDLYVQNNVRIGGYIEIDGSININSGSIDVTSTLDDGIKTITSSGHGGTFRTTSSNINDFDVFAYKRIAVGVSQGTAARIYLGYNNSYIFNDNGTLKYMDNLGNTWLINRTLI